MLMSIHHVSYFYRCAAHSVVHLITRTNTCIYIYIYIYYLGSLKFTLKHLKRSNVFRTHDHPQAAYIVPAKVIIVTDNDRVIETYRSV